MGHAWRKWSGLLLTVVWMTARLVLPLQAHCPHHTTGETITLSSAVVSAGHDVSHPGHNASTMPLHSGAPHDLAPAPCECAAACCAATPVVVDMAMVSSIPLPPLLQRVAHALSLEMRAPSGRTQTRQPPATAPPHDSTLG